MRAVWIYLLTGVLLAGCAGRPVATGGGADLNFTNDANMPETLKGLGGRLLVRETAESWRALVAKTKPTFAWNGRDLLWVETDDKGQPRFVMDEAYVYEPTNGARRVVLLDERDAKFDEWFLPVTGNNLRGVAELHESIPAPQNDWGARGDYAAVIARDAKLGTVYEVGWQRLMATGSAHPDMGRRLYLLQDAGGWHFLGEGLEEGSWHGGETSVKARVVWEKGGAAKIPLRIQFVNATTEFEAYEESMAAFAKPDLAMYDEWVLEGDFPAQIKQRSERSYLLAEKEDTVEKIVKRVGAWTSQIEDVNLETGELSTNKKALGKLRAELARLNPALPKTGAVREGTRVELLTYEEESKLAEKK